MSNNDNIHGADFINDTQGEMIQAEEEVHGRQSAPNVHASPSSIPAGPNIQQAIITGSQNELQVSNSSPNISPGGFDENNFAYYPEEEAENIFEAFGDLIIDTSSTLSAYFKYEPVIMLVVWFHIYIGLISLGGILIVCFNSDVQPLLFCTMFFFILDTVREIANWPIVMEVHQKQDFLLYRGILLLWQGTLCATFMARTSYKIVSVIPYAIYTIHELYKELKTSCQDGVVPTIGPALLHLTFVIEVSLALARYDEYFIASWYLIMSVEWLHLLLTVFCTLFALASLWVEIRSTVPQTDERKLYIQLGSYIGGEFVFLSIFQAFLYAGFGMFMENRNNNAYGVLLVGLFIGCVGSVATVAHFLYYKMEFIAKFSLLESFRRERERIRDQPFLFVHTAEDPRPRKKTFTTSTAKGVLSKISSTYFQVLSVLDLKTYLAKKKAESQKKSDILRESSERPLEVRRTNDTKVFGENNSEVANPAQLSTINEAAEPQIEPERADFKPTPGGYEQAQVNNLNQPISVTPRSNEGGKRQIRTDPQSFNIVGEQAAMILSKQPSNLKEDSIKSQELKANSNLGDDQSNSSVSLCVVCCLRTSDCVFMSCGHGGLCYDCAKDIWLQRDECHICRIPIKEILQMDPETLKGKGPIRVIGSTKMVY